LPQQAVLSEHVSSSAQSLSHESPLEDVIATFGSACDLTLPQQVALSEPVSSPAQSPLHEFPQDNIAATLGDLTLPQQAASTHVNNSYVNSLVSLGDESLYTFSPNPLSVFDGNVPMGSAFEVA
jgi:hypothetical protein